MKIQYIYIFIGISTLALNLAFTLNIIRKLTSKNHKETWDCDDVITFRLTKGESIEGGTTVAVPYDDTLPLK